MSPASSVAKNWQHDLWLEIIQASLDDRQPDYSQLPGFDQPAVSRYGATSPELLRWFKKHNEGSLYHDQVKPFNFLLSLCKGKSEGTIYKTQTKTKFQIHPPLSRKNI